MADEILIDHVVDLIKTGKEIDQLLEQINQVDRQLSDFNKKASQFGSIGTVKGLTREYAELQNMQKGLNNTIATTTKSFEGQTESVKKQLTAFEQLKKQVKDAENNAKSLAAEHGAESEQALAAARAYEVLKQKLDAVNAVVKKPQQQAQDVPFTHNLDDLEKERTLIEQTGEVVNDFDIKQAEAANSATAMGKAVKQSSEDLVSAEKGFIGLSGSLDEFTGTLHQNIIAQQENKIALKANRAEQKQLELSIKNSGAASDAQIQKLAQLRQEELLIIDANRELSLTIKNQIRDFTASEGSIDEMRAKLALLQRQYEQLSVAEKNSKIGVSLKSQIDLLDPALKKAEGEVGKFQRNVGNYGNAITGAFSKAFGFLRQIAYVVPGIGIAGIISAISGVVVDLVSALFRGKEALNAFAENYKNITGIIADANKQAGKQIADLKILYAAATDVTKSTKERTAAVVALKKEFPDYLSNIDDETIKNGEAKAAIDATTDSIIAQSRALSAKAKIDELESQRLDIAFQKQKINNAAANEKSRAKDETFIVNSGGSFGQGTTDQSKLQTKAEAQAIIEQRRLKAIKEQEQKDAILDQQEKFLIQFVGETNITKIVEDANKDRDKLKKNAAKNGSKDLEAELRARLELNRLIIQDEIDKQHAIANADVGLDVRLVARKKEAEAEMAIATLDKDFKISNEKLTASQRELILNQFARKAKDIETKLTTDLIAIRKDANDSIQAQAKADEEFLTADADRKKQKQIDTITAAYEIEQQGFERSKNQRLTALNEEFAAGKVSKQKYEDDKGEIEKDALKKSLKSQIEYYKALVGLYEFDEDKKRDALNHIAELEAKLTGIFSQPTTGAKKTAKELGEAFAGLSIVIDNATKFGDAQFDKRLNQISVEKDALEERYQREVDLINQTTVAGADRDRKLADAAAKRSAQQKILDEQEKQEKIKKARFDKQQAIFSIIINTAKAVVDALGNPGKVAQAAAIGAAELAVAIAAPLPRFFKGKNANDNYEGYAWVDDGGKPELIIREDGSMEVGTGQPRITYLNKNDIVLPDAKIAQETLIQRSMINSQTALIPIHSIPTNGAELQVLQEQNNLLRRGFSQLKSEIRHSNTGRKKASWRTIWDAQDAINGLKNL